MKTQISALELHFIIVELQKLILAKVNKIFEPEKKELFLHLHHPLAGKQMLRILVPSVIYLSTEKPENPQRPSGFCMLLRKYLDGARLRKVEQVGFERILRLTFETREGVFCLIAEFFNKGNIILTKEGIILGCAEVQEWSDRKLCRGEPYTHPKNQYNVLELTKSGLHDLLSSSKQTTIVKTLAVELGLGGTFSEEACTLAQIQKDSPPKEITDKDQHHLLTALHKLTSRKIEAVLVKNKESIDVLPFPTVSCASSQKQEFPTFNDAVDYVFSHQLVQKQNESAKQSYTKKANKLQSMIEEQEKQVQGLKISIEEATKQGELVYEHYKLLQDVISELNKARRTHSLQEIKEKLKGHKLIKDVNTKDKYIVVEV